MTERIYYTDARCVAFEATVEGVEDEGRRVYLDRSAFYPTSGGQPHDLGTLDGAVVVDVVDQDDRVAHLLGAPLGVPVGSAVHGRIDWTRRWDHMQQHTGQHLISAVMAELFGWSTVSVHFGPGSSTIDFDAGDISPDQLREAEDRVNLVVAEARPVAVSFEDANAVEGLRKASSRSGTLRIITIDDIDRSACGGTHVARTSEIGPVLLRRTERVKGGVRVEFLCGRRALSQARADSETLSAAGRALTAGAADVPAAVKSLQAQLKEALSVRRKLEEELSARRARELHQAAAPDAAGRRRIVLTDTDYSMDELRSLGIALGGMPGAVLVAAHRGSRGIVFSAAADTGINAGERLRAAVSAHAGRGGGSPRAAQGTVPDDTSLDAVLTELAS